MVAVLVILDGASEPLYAGEPTSLERAVTPVLDRLVASGELSRLRTVAAGLPAGSESAIPALLGWVPPAPVDRGGLEAAAHEVPLEPGERAWRVDVLDASGERAAEVTARRATDELRASAPRHTVRQLAGHRLLLTGPPPLPAVARRPGLRPWPEGVLPPRLLDDATTVVAARGAATGIARLMGARAVVPDGATGREDTDLQAKAAAALAAIERGATCVVVHVGAPDEAAHERDAAAKVAAIERIDRELLAPLAAAVGRAGGTLRVCPDHGCDPRSGAHDAGPVPCLDWPAMARRDALLDRRLGAPPPSSVARRPAHDTTDSRLVGRLTERAVAALPVRDLTVPPASAEAA